MLDNFSFNIKDNQCSEGDEKPVNFDVKGNIPFDAKKVAEFIRLIRSSQGLDGQPDDAGSEDFISKATPGGVDVKGKHDSSSNCQGIQDFINQAAKNPDYILQTFLLYDNDFAGLARRAKADKIQAVTCYPGIPQESEDGGTSGSGSDGLSVASFLESVVEPPMFTGGPPLFTGVPPLVSSSEDGGTSGSESGSESDELSVVSFLESVVEPPEPPVSTGFPSLVPDREKPQAIAFAGLCVNHSDSDSEEEEKKRSPTRYGHHSRAGSSTFSFNTLRSPVTSGSFSNGPRPRLETRSNSLATIEDVELEEDDSELLQRCADFLWLMVVASATKFGARRHITDYVNQASVDVLNPGDELKLRAGFSLSVRLSTFCMKLNAIRLLLVRFDRLATESITEVLADWQKIVAGWLDLKAPNTSNLHNPDSIPWQVAGVPAGGFILGVASYSLYSLRFLLNASVSLLNFYRYHAKVKNTAAGELKLSVPSFENYTRGHAMRNDFMWAGMNALHYHWAKHETHHLGTCAEGQVEVVANVGTILLVVLYWFDVANAWYKMRSMDKAYEQYLTEVLEKRREDLKQELSDLYQEEGEEKNSDDKNEDDKGLSRILHKKYIAFTDNERNIWEYEIDKRKNYIINKSMLNAAKTFAVLMTLLCLAGLFVANPAAGALAIATGSVKSLFSFMIVATHIACFILKPQIEKYVKYLVESTSEQDTGKAAPKEPKLWRLTKLFMPEAEMENLKELRDKGPNKTCKEEFKKRNRTCRYSFFDGDSKQTNTETTVIKPEPDCTDDSVNTVIASATV
jgi:hypothetical protein